MKENRKVVLIGTGMVGMSMAFSIINTGGIDELVLIDVDIDKAKGETMDLNHGLPYSDSYIKVKYGGYKECDDADIVVICAGANQKEGQTRLDLVKINTRIMVSICKEIKRTLFNGIIIVASNPVDILSYVAYKVTNYESKKIIGSGTLLDTARLKYLLGSFLNVSSDDIHAYILGEHGDSSFVSWTNCYVGCKSLLSYMDDKELDMNDLNEIYNDVKNAAYNIISMKKATYYGIGVSLNKLINSIFNDAHNILCVSTLQNNEYKVDNIYMGVPCVISREGIKEVLKLPLNEVDQKKFYNSYNVLKEITREIKKEIS